MTSYTPPRSSQNLNPFMASSPLTLPQYANNENASYNYSLQPHHENVPPSDPTYSTYATSHISSQSQDAQCLSENLQMAAQHPPNTSVLDNNATPPRPVAQTDPCSFQHLLQHSPSQSLRYFQPSDPFQSSDVESQDSYNESTMRSEPIFPPLSGFPDSKDFDRLIKSYVDSLSSKKQDKALIHAKRAKNIKAVLIDKKTTAVESAQFRFQGNTVALRFWVKKMFTLSPNDSKTPDRWKNVCHEGKPVAVREKLFKILTTAHKQCQHGGRDKTSAEVRKVYSWVPKEIISRFVKLCPTCRARRRTTLHMSPLSSPRKPVFKYSPPQTPELLSPAPRRESLLSRQSPMFSPSPISTNTHGSRYQGSQWLSSAHYAHSPVAVRPEPRDVLTSSPAISDIDSNGLPLNFASAGFQDGSVGCHRSYSVTYDAANNYSRHQHY